MRATHGPGDRLAQARRLKAVREWRDVTRADVARAVGVDASTITVWEKGRLPQDDRLELAAKFLRVSAAWIRYGIESEAPDIVTRALIDPSRDTRISDEELDRADESAAQTRAARGKPKPKPDGGKRRRSGGA